MSAPTISRTAWTDDDGSGTTGTVINNAAKTSLYDEIDGLAASLYADIPTPPSGAIVGTTDTQTLTNKRVTPRVTTITSSATPTINTDNCDAVTITALAAAITSMTTNLSGTPTDFQKLIIRIKDNGTPRTIAWGAAFIQQGAALPTTTVANKVLTVGFIWDSVALAASPISGAWGCVGAVLET